jgi:hypothetical protein
MFIFSKALRSSAEHPQPVIQIAPAAISPELRRPEFAFGKTLTSRAQVENE